MYNLNLPTVETERLILRPIQLSDAQDMFEYASDFDNASWVTFALHKSVEESREIIQNFFLPRVENGAPTSICLQLKENNKMIGTCDIFTIDRYGTGEIGYIINKKYWNQGLVTEACKKVIELAFEHVGLRRIEIMCGVDNIGSKRVIEKCGLVFEGIRRQYAPSKDGKYYDCNLYSMLKEEYEKRKEDEKAIGT